MTKQELIERAAQDKEWDHEDAIEEDRERRVNDLARVNYSTAVDQAGEYESLQDALDAYEENVVDTAVEKGWNTNDTFDAASIFRALAAAAK